MAVNHVSGKTMYEILKEANSKRAIAERVKILHVHNSLVLRDILKGNFDETIVWMLPEGTPPFIECPPESKASPVGKAARVLKYLIRNRANAKMHEAKRERIFIQMLEAIDPMEAKVMIAMKDKKLEDIFPHINLKVVKEAFPDLIT